MRFVTIVLAGLCLATSPAFAQETLQSLAHDQARFDQAAADYDAGNYEQAYNEFLALADDNDIAAMRNVALMKRRGQGTDKDPEGARDYLERAADGGLPTAQYDLGQMLLDGEGGDADPKAAVSWLAMAASAHHPMAAYRLGELFEEGKVVPQDLAKAEELYAEAAGRGVQDAAARLSALEAAKAKASEPPPSP
ncbi:MAG TPA: tetratricopeptide repeat protein [Rhizomicrobium sp.]|nr:tetratricopeptide repeat protein [Rhizomicrobium sp.]